MLCVVSLFIVCTIPLRVYENSAGLKCRSQVTGQITGYRPQATGQVTGQVTGHRSHVTGHRSGHRPQVTGHRSDHRSHKKNNGTLDKTVLD